MSQGELRRWVAWGLLVLLIAVAWSNGLGAEFTYDDKVEVIGNRTIRFLERWELVLGYNWSRPITTASYALNYRVGGLEPYSYHLVDVALHGLCAGLAMLLVTAIAELRGLKKPLVTGALAAGLWALHPLGTESVTYITGRSEQLCALFYLMGCWAWLRWSHEGGLQRLALAGAAVGFGLMTKEVAVTMPVAYLLLEAFAQRGGALGEVRWRRYAPWGLALVAFLLFRSAVLVGEAAEPVEGGAYAWLVHQVTGMRPLRPLGVQLLTEAEVIWRYLGLTLLPVGQSIFHDHPETGLTARSGAAALGLIALTLAAILGRRRAPLAAAGWLWFLLILLPSSSLIPLKETMAEHRAFLSTLGVSWVVAAGLMRLPQPGGLGLGVCVALALAGLTRARNAVWATEQGVWAEAVERNPGSAEAWYGYGDALRYARQLPEAKAAFERSIALEPGLEDAWNNLGIVQAMMGDEDEAEQTWREVLRRHPTFCKAHNNLGLLYARNERPQDAGAEFRTTLAYCPRDCRAHRYLGELYAEPLDDKEKAILHLETFLELCPSDSMSAEVRAMRDALTW
ncbi:MAG: tetratricopeptide repeat protein [Alphaproteobacteria bacterium]|nr:tetratricopeptide repeat protein [Alphaproteobacteria bacterium]